MSQIMASHPLMADLLVRNESAETVKQTPINASRTMMQNRMHSLGNEGPNFPPSANDAFKEMVWASRQKRIKEISIKRIVTDLSTLIQAIFKEAANQHSVKAREQERIPEITRNVMDYLQRDFRFFSLADVTIAFYEGVDGQFGEFGYLYERTFYRWLKAYRKMRSDVLREQNRFEVDESKRQGSTDHSKNLTDEAICQILLREYREYVATGIYRIEDHSNIRYQLLIKLNLISMNPRQEEQFMKQALYQCNSGLSGPASERTLQFTAHELALKAFLEQLRGRGSNLESLLHRAKNRR